VDHADDIAAVLTNKKLGIRHSDSLLLIDRYSISYFSPLHKCFLCHIAGGTKRSPFPISLTQV
jgi:hypothetical protein